MVKKWICWILAALLLCSATACSRTETEKRPSAQEGLQTILDGLIASSTEEESLQWSAAYFQGQTLTVPGIETERFGYILFKDLQYEILSAEEDGDTAQVRLRLQNRYLPETFIYYWAWQDNEYVHFANQGLLMQDGYYETRGTYTAEVTLQLQYSQELSYQDRPLQQNGATVSGWTVQCTDEVINALYGDILKTDYVANGQRFLVTAETFSQISDLAEEMAAGFDACAAGDEAALAALKGQTLRCCYLLSELTYCSSAWDYSQSEPAAALLESLLSAAAQCRAGESVDLDTMVRQPLSAMEAA